MKQRYDIFNRTFGDDRFWSEFRPIVRRTQRTRFWDNNVRIVREIKAEGETEGEGKQIAPSIRRTDPPRSRAPRAAAAAAVTLSTSRAVYRRNNRFAGVLSDERDIVVCPALRKSSDAFRQRLSYRRRRDSNVVLERKFEDRRLHLSAKSIRRIS